MNNSQLSKMKELIDQDKQDALKNQSASSSSIASLAQDLKDDDDDKEMETFVSNTPSNQDKLFLYI